MAGLLHLHSRASPGVGVGSSAGGAACHEGEARSARSHGDSQLLRSMVNAAELQQL